MPPYPNEKPKRTVTFASQLNTTYVTDSIQINKNKQNAIWYNCDELYTFRANARAHAKLVMGKENDVDARCFCFRQSLETPSLDLSELLLFSIINTGTQASIKDREVSRGLESKINLERQWNRRLAVRATLEAQRKLKQRAALSLNPYEFYSNSAPRSIAHITRKFSKWARDIALFAGAKDAYDINPTIVTVFKIKKTYELARSFDHPKHLRSRKRKITTETAENVNKRKNTIESGDKDRNSVRVEDLNNIHGDLVISY